MMQRPAETLNTFKITLGCNKEPLKLVGGKKVTVKLFIFDEMFDDLVSELLEWDFELNGKLFVAEQKTDEPIL